MAGIYIVINTLEIANKYMNILITYLINTGIVIAIIITLNLIKSKSKQKPKSIMDELNEIPQFKEMKALYDAMSELNEDGTEEDTIPEGYGEFGHEVTNPIPVNTVFGNIAYLGKLRTLEGKKVEYVRLCSTGAPNIKNPIDIYRIHYEGEELGTLYICPYHKRNSERAPKGFKLATLLK